MIQDKILTEVTAIRAELAGIRLALEGLLESTNPLNELTEWRENPDIHRVEYTDEERAIVEYKLGQMGKEYKEHK